MELAQLLELCRKGDALAWEALVRRFQSRVYGLAFHYVRDREEARDLAQEVFVRIYQRLGTYREDDSFLPWMLRVARNVCIDHLRRMKVRTPAHGVPMEDAPEPVDPGPTPQAAWEADARKQLVYRAMQHLSEISREMILLKEIEGLRLDEIASMLDLPLGTVKSRSNRARLELARAVLSLESPAGEGLPC